MLTLFIVMRINYSYYWNKRLHKILMFEYFSTACLEYQIFFSRSPQRMSALENVAGRRVPRPSSTRWNFKSRTVNAVKEMKDQIIECCSILEASKSRET